MTWSFMKYPEAVEGERLDARADKVVRGGVCPDCGAVLTEGPHGGLSVNWYCSGPACGSRFNVMGPIGVERISGARPLRGKAAKVCAFNRCPNPPTVSEVDIATGHVSDVLCEEHAVEAESSRRYKYERGPAPGASTPTVEPRWRVGRKVGRTLYLDNHLAGLMDTPEMARRAVEGLNGAEDLHGELETVSGKWAFSQTRLSAALDAIRCEARDCGCSERILKAIGEKL